MNPARPRRPRGGRRRPQVGKGKCKPTGKVRFPDVDRAYAAALRLSASLGRGIRAYSCPACSGWHLTRRPTWTEDTP